MKTKIVVTVAVLISGVFLVYAKIKGEEAERSAEEVIRQVRLAEAETERAEEMALLAQQSAAEALEAASDAQSAMGQLLECQNGN